jgi:hypothetical protein
VIWFLVYGCHLTGFCFFAAPVYEHEEQTQADTYYSGEYTSCDLASGSAICLLFLTQDEKSLDISVE